MDTDKNNSIITIVPSEAEGSYAPAQAQYKKQDPSTSLRCGQNDNNAVIRVHLRSSVD